MGLLGFFKAVGGALGGFFKAVFGGLVGVFVEDFEEVCERIVKILLDLDMPGSEKLRKALDVLLVYAAIEGKRFVNHAARFLIELELFKSRTGDEWQELLERLLDMGLEPARQAVEAVDATDLVGDDERRDAAVEKLRADLIAAGREWLTDTIRMTEKWILNLLVECAVAKMRVETT